MKLPEEFLKRMKVQLGKEYPSFLESYLRPPVRGLRVNTAKIPADEFAAVSPWALEKTGIIEEGFTVTGAEGIGRHPYHIAGLFYMQEPSAMSAAAASGADGCGLKVLDMCAAPGGKAGAMAARMRGRGILIANEIVPKRALLLARNLERLGVTNAAVTCERPDRIAEELPGYFDIVAVDAPCSGEGMFRKDETAIAEWSPEHVLACAQRQGLIMDSAAECVKPGGSLVYSTCTFSTEENEGVIEGFLKRHREYEVEFMQRLYPHTSVGEGHFVCRLRRFGGEFRDAANLCRNVKMNGLGLLAEAYATVVSDVLPEGVPFETNGRVRLAPMGMPEAVLKLRPVSLGVELGELKKDRLEPAHAFFAASFGMSFERELVLEPDSPETAAFLAGATLPCPEEWHGYSAVSVRAGSRAYPIGFGKAVQGVMKNKLPKGLYVN